MFTAVVWFHFNLQFRGVRIIVVGIGPDAQRHKYRQVLEMIGGKNLFFVDDYANLDDATEDIVKLICRKYNLVWVDLGIVKVVVFCMKFVLFYYVS